jgi:hypothetical protein
MTYDPMLQCMFVVVALSAVSGCSWRWLERCFTILRLLEITGRWLLMRMSFGVP